MNSTSQQQRNSTCERDILMNMNKWHVVTLLVLLDLLSVGFDTVDQRILHDRLRSSFEISGLVLSWSSYYLNNRSQLLYFSKWRKHSWPAGRCASMVGPCRSAFCHIYMQANRLAY